MAAGGGYAYYKKGSSASLQSSLTVAAALLASAWLLGVNPAIGTALGLSKPLSDLVPRMDSLCSSLPASGSSASISIQLHRY